MGKVSSDDDSSWEIERKRKREKSREKSLQKSSQVSSRPSQQPQKKRRLTLDDVDEDDGVEDSASYGNLEKSTTQQDEQDEQGEMEEIICPSEAPDVFDLEAQIMSKTDHSDETIYFLAHCGNEARRAVLFMENKWLKYKDKNQYRGKSFETISFDILGITAIDPVETLNQCMNAERKYLSSLRVCLKTLNILINKDQKRVSREDQLASELIHFKLTRIENAINGAKGIIMNAMKMHRLIHDENEGGDSLLSDKGGKKNEKNKRSDYNELIRYYVEKAQLCNLYRYRGDIYREIKLPPQNIATHTFEKAMSMEEFVTNYIDTEDEIYDRYISHARMIPDLVKGLTNIGEFPIISPNRYLSSYKNGIFDCLNVTFHRWDQVTKDMIACRFHPYYFLHDLDSVRGCSLVDINSEMQKRQEIKEQIEKTTAFKKPVPSSPDDGPNVSAWYSDQYSPEEHTVEIESQEEADVFIDATVGMTRPRMYTEQHWFDIQTPFFDKILVHQKFDRNVMRWVYVMVGRLQFELGKLDNWQIMAFFKGVAGTGKSTLLNTSSNLFDFQHVSIVSNNIERKFGLDPISESQVWFCSEVKKDFGLSQAEWQCMVCGDPVSVACKFGKARIIPQWTVPGMMAGNELPGFVDSEGSFSRRILLWEFTQHVDDDADMGMSAYLKMEMPAIRYKATVAYHQAVADHGKKRLMTRGILPNYFHKTNTHTKILSNSLVSFINDEDQVVKGKNDDPTDCVWPFEKFKEAYDSYCKSQNLVKVSLNDDVTALFKQYGIIKRHNIERQWDGPMLPKQCYLYGIKPVGLE